jgi:hypothetical protein
VEWGRASADAVAGALDDLEPTFGAKTDRLLRVLRRYPQLEGLDVVRVAFSDLVVVPSATKTRRDGPPRLFCAFAARRRLRL